MGCSSSRTKDNLLEQTKPINLSVNEKGEELKEAQTLINLIIKIRNRIIYKYHKLIYLTGACLFLQPNISHCLRNIFYKISCDFKGNFNECNFQYFVDPPYLFSDKLNLKEESKILLDELLKFITELRGYKNILKQIDNDSPNLLYLEYENKSNISERNIEKIHNSMDIFKELLNMRQKIWNQYKNEIQILVKQYEPYIKKVDKIGKEAYDKNLSDIYEICILEHKEDDDKKKKMYSSVEEAKHNWEDVMKNDYDTDLDFSINNL